MNIVIHKLEQFVHGSDDFQALAKIFKSYFRKFARQYFLIAILIIISSAATGASAWFVKDIVNTVFVQNNYNTLYFIVFAVIVLFTLRGMAMYLQSTMMARISSRIVASIQIKIFEQVTRQRVKYFENRTSDHLIMLINQGASSFNSIMTRVVLSGARDIVTVVVLFGVMFFQDPLLTLLCLTTVPIVYIGINILLRKIKELSEQELKSFVDLNRYMREAVQGVRVVKSYNMQERVNLETKEVIQLLRERTNKIAALNEAPVPILDTLGGVAVAMAILYAGIRAATGTYDVGTFMSFLTALLLAADPARRVSQLRVNLRKSLIGVRMIYDFFAEDNPEPVGIISAGLSPKSSIEFQSVRFSYNKGQDVLKGIDLKVGPGETVAFVGPSGAGKSTIFNLLLKFYEPTSGKILIGDQDLREWNTHSLRSQIAYVGQSNFIFSGTIEDNLRIGRPDADPQQLLDVCEQVGLMPFVKASPRGLSTPIGELGSSISGGQAQRLNIARAILKDAPILLLDEVTSALDAENEALIKSYIARQRGVKTVLIIAHRLSTVRDADQIAILDNGYLIAAGPHEELMESNGYYSKVVRLQLTG